MMWLFRQSTGALLRPSGERVALGYSGKGEGKNNPAMQAVHNVGPCPCGVFDICAPEETAHHGPFVLRLMPRPSTEMFGRDGFLIHGDNGKLNGSASEGCVILSRDVREAIWDSGDHVLQVIP